MCEPQLSFTLPQHVIVMQPSSGNASGNSYKSGWKMDELEIQVYLRGSTEHRNKFESKIKERFLTLTLTDNKMCYRITSVDFPEVFIIRWRHHQEDYKHCFWIIIISHSQLRKNRRLSKPYGDKKRVLISIGSYFYEKYVHIVLKRGCWFFNPEGQ